MKFTFGDIVVVEGKNLGVVVKSWLPLMGPDKKRGAHHEVYVRMHNRIMEFYEDEMERYMVRHKYLPEEEKEYQYNAINNL